MSKVPKFTNEQQEAEFWATHDATEFMDETMPVDVTFADARPPQTRILVQLDPEVVDRLKTVAQHKGVDYQTLIRLWVRERLAQETG